MSSRYEELLDRVEGGATRAIEKFDVDQFDHLVRHAGVQSRRFRDELVKHMRSKTRRDANTQLELLEFPARLSEVENAERRAWDRRARLASTPGEISPHDMPVQLSNYSTEQLVDCQLREPRTQWLAELENRKLESTKLLDSLNTQLEDKKYLMRSKLVDVEERLARMRNIESLMKR